MYQKILVPLDGSELAECVLPHVKSIAAGCGIREVVLVRVVEPIPMGGAEGVNLDEIQNANVRAAEEYLAGIRAELSKEGLNVDVKVLTGRPAETIADFAQHNEVDFVAIATHGRSGFSRWVFGSVADRLVRSLYAPVLLIRPQGCESGT
ncbi:MAG: universal stress protein [Dehalococcoidia bacterium]